MYACLYYIILASPARVYMYVPIASSSSGRLSFVNMKNICLFSLRVIHHTFEERWLSAGKLLLAIKHVRHRGA